VNVDGEIIGRAVGEQWVAIIPLTFGRVRLVVGHVDDPMLYDDGW
jgi:hypothetical protein